MTKTKEEILFPLHEHLYGEIEMIYTQENASKAMDEWAEIVAIDFENWRASTGWNYSHGFYWSPNMTSVTTKELYSVFLKKRGESKC